MVIYSFICKINCCTITTYEQWLWKLSNFTWDDPCYSNSWPQKPDILPSTGVTFTLDSGVTLENFSTYFVFSLYKQFLNEMFLLWKLVINVLNMITSSWNTFYRDNIQAYWKIVQSHPGWWYLLYIKKLLLFYIYFIHGNVCLPKAAAPATAMPPTTLIPVTHHGVSPGLLPPDAMPIDR